MNIKRCCPGDKEYPCGTKARRMNDFKIASASQIRKDGLQALEEKLGVVGTIRFLQQFDNGGNGDYTKEKYEKKTC